MKRNYIGLATTSHDSALAIVNSNGEVVFAEATERYLQDKRALNVQPDLPLRVASLIRTYCEPDAEIVQAFSWTDTYEKWMNDQLPSIMSSLTDESHSSLPAAAQRRLSWMSYAAVREAKALSHRGNALKHEIQRWRGAPNKPVEKRYFNHHLTHAAYACFSSPFEEALCAVVDGFGEHRASGCYVYRNGRLEEVATPPEGATSLGFFYSDICEACGFDPRAGEEWKVMGLAAYGQPDPNAEQILGRMIDAKGLQLTSPSFPELLNLRGELDKIGRTPGQPAIEMANLAHTAQKVFERTLFGYLTALHATGKSNNLVLGGGCALNSSANGRVLEQTPFKQLHVCSAPADDGNAIGAALLAYQQDHPEYPPPGKTMTPYLGSQLSSERLAQLREFGGIRKLQACNGSAPQRAAELLSRGRIVGWIQGRAEFGPRALGNRSILADARVPDVKERLNANVKFREEFRPFAPAILHEHGAAYFENYQESPYMERTLRFRDAVRKTVPGAVHVDGTGRLQTVKPEWNARFYTLLAKFFDLTGVPLIINTSFNVMGKPIAHSVEDALAVFFTSGIDALFLDDLLIEKDA